MRSVPPLSRFVVQNSRFFQKAAWLSSESASAAPGSVFEARCMLLRAPARGVFLAHQGRRQSFSMALFLPQNASLLLVSRDRNREHSLVRSGVCAIRCARPQTATCGICNVFGCAFRNLRRNLGRPSCAATIPWNRFRSAMRERLISLIVSKDAGMLRLYRISMNSQK